MSIAWGSLVLLVLLLPGVLFFLGAYWPEQFTREAEARSPLGQLAGALLIAFLIHGFLYSVLGGLCGPRVPCISIEHLLATLSGDPSTSRSVGPMMHEFRWWIFVYVVMTSAAGIGLGALYGWLVSTRRIRGFSRHHWIYDLSVDGLTYAYVLTHVRHEERVLLYRGFLRAFGLQHDGRFSYIVLSDVTRAYLNLVKTGSETAGLGVRKVIGSSSPEGAVLLPTDPAPRKRLKSLFVIEGEDIANAVFDILETPAQPVSKEVLRTVVIEEAKKIRRELSDAEIEEILRAL